MGIEDEVRRVRETRAEEARVNAGEGKRRAGEAKIPPEVTMKRRLQESGALTDLEDLRRMTGDPKARIEITDKGASLVWDEVREGKWQRREDPNSRKYGDLLTRNVRGWDIREREYVDTTHVWDEEGVREEKRVISVDVERYEDLPSWLKGEVGKTLAEDFVRVSEAEERNYRTSGTGKKKDHGDRVVGKGIVLIDKEPISLQAKEEHDRETEKYFAKMRENEEGCQSVGGYMSNSSMP